MIFKKFIFLTSFLMFSTLIFSQENMNEVTLKDAKGNPIQFSEVIKADKPVIVSFWATWCAPCKKELDNIAEVYDDWQKKYDVEVIAITIDDARALPKIKPMVAQKKWKYTVLSDVNSDLKKTLNFPNVPQTFLIDKSGNIVYSHSGYAPGDEDELEKKIKKIASK